MCPAAPEGIGDTSQRDMSVLRREDVCMEYVRGRYVCKQGVPRKYVCCIEQMSVRAQARRVLGSDALHAQE